LSNSTVSELDALPGLESAKRAVVGLAAGSAVQAVLFYGIPGSGKERIAEILTKAWLCRQPTPQGACGECQACRAFERGKSADYLPIEPVGTSRNIRIGAMVETDPPDDAYPIKAQLFVRTPPLAARSKVVAILEADRLLPRAANSLLKILEEPPPYARFLLVTESVGAILPTILSRCLAVACEVPRDVAGCEPWALALASGAPGRAQDIQESAALYRPIYDFAQELPQRSPAAVLVASEEFDRLADALESGRRLGARAANAEALQVLATAYALAPGARAGALKAMIEAHRRILGNANAMGVFDALFSKALA